MQSYGIKLFCNISMWSEAQAAAKDRTLWRSIVIALFPIGDEEDKSVSK